MPPIVGFFAAFAMGAGVSLSAVQSWRCGCDDNSQAVYSPADGTDPSSATQQKPLPPPPPYTPRAAASKRVIAAATQIVAIVPSSRPAAATETDAVKVEEDPILPPPVMVSPSVTTSVRVGKALRKITESAVSTAPASGGEKGKRALGHVRFSSVSEIPLGSDVQSMKDAIRDATGFKEKGEAAATGPKSE